MVTSTESLSILIVDDDAFNREGVRLYLTQRGFCVAEAGDEATALALARQRHFAVAVLDIAIPQLPDQRARSTHSTGIRLARHLKRHDPRIGIVLFSAYEDRGQEVFELLESGMRGLAYLLKGCPPDELVHAIHLAHQGQLLIDQDVTNIHAAKRSWMKAWSDEERLLVERAARNLATLTLREQEIASMLASSLTPESIAARLQLSARTVENHITRIYYKLRLSDAPEHLRRLNLLTKAWLVYTLVGGAEPEADDETRN